MKPASLTLRLFLIGAVLVAAFGWIGWRQVLEEVKPAVRQSTEETLVDTANLMHCAFSEIPKGLQFGATLYCWAPVWKRLTDETDDEEGKT